MHYLPYLLLWFLVACVVGIVYELEQILATLEQPPWNEGSKERQTALKEAVNHEHGPVTKGIL